MKKLFLIAATLAGTSLGGAPEAVAADRQQTAVSACAVVYGANVADLGTFVGISSGNTGTVTLHCPVDVNLASFDQTEVSYRDSDGTGNVVKVDVVVTRVDKTNVASISHQLVFQSSLYSTTVWNDRFQAVGSTYTFDHVNYYYYIQVHATRTSTSASAQVGHVKLCTNGVSC